MTTADEKIRVAQSIAQQVADFNTGARNGYLDGKLGHNLMVARYSSNEDYARGYRYGQSKAAGYVE